MDVMEVDVDRARARIDVSHNEMRIIGNALNEILNGVELPHFQTRMGASKDDVRELLTEFRGLLRRYSLPDW